MKYRCELGGCKPPKKQNSRVYLVLYDRTRRYTNNVHDPRTCDPRACDPRACAPRACDPRTCDSVRRDPRTRNR